MLHPSDYDDSAETTFSPTTTRDTPEKGVETEVSLTDSKAINCLTSADEDVPDGGLRAWSVVTGSFFALFATFGVVNAYGVFQDYYSDTLLSESSSSVISLIGALQLFILYGSGPVVGKIFDAYGSQILLPVGSFITVFSMMMVSLCQNNRPYQLFLSQGILFGIGNALVFSPALAVLGHWFRNKRAYALGIAASGSSLGGVIYPIMLQRLIPMVGFGWAVRATGFVTLACLSVSCLTLRTRLPLRGKVSLLDAIDLGGLKDPRYVLAGIGAFLTFYALFIPYFYIEVSADIVGVSPNLSKYELVIINACGIPARILPGLLADRFGSLNTLVPLTLVSGILVLALWLPSRGAIPITLFSASYGLFSGAFVSLLPAYIAVITPREKYGARLGTIYLVVAVANLVGTPTAGAFVKTNTQEHFNHLIIFSGILVLCGGIMLAVARFIHSNKIFARI